MDFLTWQPIPVAAPPTVTGSSGELQPIAHGGISLIFDHPPGLPMADIRHTSTSIFGQSQKGKGWLTFSAIRRDKAWPRSSFCQTWLTVTLYRHDVMAIFAFITVILETPFA